MSDIVDPITEDASPVLSHRTPRGMLTALYHGRSETAVRFRTAWVIIDLAIIAFFIAAPLIRESAFFLTIDYAIAA